MIITDKVVLLIIEYFQNMSAQTTSEKNTKYGLNAIIHVFKMSFIANKNADVAYCHAQNAIFSFTNYLEQINNSATTISADLADILAFIYENAFSSNDSNMINNMLSTMDNDIVEYEKNVQVLNRVLLITNVLLWMNNSMISVQTRTQIMEEYFSKYTELFLQTHTDYIMDYIMCIQDKLRLHPEQYLVFLETFHKQMRKSIKHQQMPSYQQVQDTCLFICQYKGQTIDEIGIENGWKTPAADLAKYLFLE